MKRIFSFLALFVLVAGFAFANGGSNDLAYYKYSELKETASVGLTDEFIVVESNIPKKGGTIGDIIALVGIGGDDITGDGTGTISGMLSSVEIATTGDTLTVAEAGKTIIVEPLLEEYTTLTYVLPTPAAGIEFTFIAASNDTINVDPASTDTTIYYLTLDGGDKIVSPAATADSVTLIGYDSTSWGVKAMHGTWTDGS